MDSINIPGTRLKERQVAPLPHATSSTVVWGVSSPTSMMVWSSFSVQAVLGWGRKNSLVITILFAV